MSATRLVALGVALAALVAYAGTLGFDFVWDDTLLIQRSFQLHQWRALPAALTSHFWAEVHEHSYYYRPFITLTFFLDLKLWGLNPLGFHLTNVLAHLATSLALLALARRLTGSDVAAGGTALLFALDPLHTESVAFVSGRTDVFAALFFLLALLGYIRWRDRGGAGAWTGSLLAFFLALMSKEVAVMLPAILVLYDWTCRREAPGARPIAQALLRYLPYGAVIALYAGMRVAVLGGLVEANSAPWAGLGTRVLTGLEIIARYAWLVVVPYPANAYYPITPVPPPPGPGWWLMIGFLAVMLGLTAVATARSRPLAFGALWFWLTLVPAAGVNFLPLSAPILAERFLYLPTAGFCLVLGIGLRRLLGDTDLGRTLGRSSQLPVLPGLGLALVLVSYAALTLWRNEDWKDDYRLYLRMVETSPQAALPHVNLAFTQISKGEVASANEHLKKAVEILPGNPRALVGLALTQTVLGDLEAGLGNALKAYAYAPQNPNILSTLGAVYLYRQEPARAALHLENSLRINPGQVNAVLNLALAYAKLGRQADAEAMLSRGIALNAMMSPHSSFPDRVAAEIYGDRDPARSRAAWERYIASLRQLPQPSARQGADLDYAERQVARLAGAPR